MKISGMERKSSGKRDSLLAQAKDAKESMKPPAKVCFSKDLIEFLKLKYMVAWEHNFWLEEKAVNRLNKRWDYRGMIEFV